MARAFSWAQVWGGGEQRGWHKFEMVFQWAWACLDFSFHSKEQEVCNQTSYSWFQPDTAMVLRRPI